MSIKKPKATWSFRYGKTEWTFCNHWFCLVNKSPITPSTRKMSKQCQKNASIVYWWNWSLQNHSNFKEQKRYGHHVISNEMLKCCSPIVEKYHVKAFNRCIDSQKVPNFFKVAKVVPISKKGERDCPENYRPISLRCSFRDQIEHVTKKLNKFSDMIYKVRYMHPVNCLLNFCSSFAKSIITYGLLVYGSAAKTNSKKIESAQRIFLRAISAKIGMRISNNFSRRIIY